MFKNIIGSGSWKYQWVIALGFLVSGSAVALPFPPNPIPMTGGAWVIGSDLPDPITGDDGVFRIDVNGGPWTKELQNPFTLGFAPNTGAEMIEFLKLTSGSNVSKWTETVETTGWEWDTVFGASLFVNVNALDGFFATVNFLPAACVSCQVVEFTWDLEGSILALGYTSVADFWATGPGQFVFIDIDKRLNCAGVGVAEDNCVGNITVQENPAPEPGTLLLLGAGLAGLAGLRRRRYS